MNPLLFLLTLLVLSCSSTVQKNAATEPDPLEGEWHLYKRTHETAMHDGLTTNVSIDREFLERDGLCEIVIVTAEEDQRYLFTYLPHFTDSTIPEQQLKSPEIWGNFTLYDSTLSDSVTYTIDENGANVLITTTETSSTVTTSYYLPNSKEYNE